MSAPIIQFYGVDGGGIETPGVITLAQFLSLAGGSVKAGTDSRPFRLRVYNDKGITNALTATATDVDITTIGANSLVTDKWIRTSYDGVTYSPTGIGGTDVSQFPGSIAKGDFQDTYLKAVVPSNAVASTYNFLLRVSYSYTD